MSFALLVPEKRKRLELLDLSPEAYAPEELAGSLADLRAVNRCLGDQRAIMKYLKALGASSAPFSLLDVATGSADIPVAIARWARKAGVSAAITGVDINEQSIAIARREAEGYPEVTLAVADGLHLPFPDKSFDFVLCSKTTHHLSEPQNVRLIREMLRVARRGYIIMDLRRSWIACALIYILTRLLVRNRVTRHDAPLSVLKSFTDHELADLAAKAGASRFTVSREPFWLLVLSGKLA